MNDFIENEYVYWKTLMSESIFTDIVKPYYMCDYILTCDYNHIDSICVNCNNHIDSGEGQDYFCITMCYVCKCMYIFDTKSPEVSNMCCELHNSLYKKHKLCSIVGYYNYILDVKFDVRNKFIYDYYGLCVYKPNETTIYDAKMHKTNYTEIVNEGLIVWDFEDTNDMLVNMLDIKHIKRSIDNVSLPIHISSCLEISEYSILVNVKTDSGIQLLHIICHFHG